MSRRKALTFKHNGVEALGTIRGTFPLGNRLILDPCVYCGGPSNSKDHIIPRSLGGLNHWTNIAKACNTCNSKKGSTPLLHFLVSLLKP